MAIPNEYWDFVDNISGMKGSEKSVLNFLCRKANPKQNYSSWYSVSEMARICCLSEMSIKNATKTLSGMGLISKQLRRDSSSIYTLNLERIAQLGRNNICLYQKEDKEAKPTENLQQDIGGDNNCLSYRQILPEGETNTVYKNVNENVNENVRAGGKEQVTHCKNISDEILSFWKVIHAHVKEVYQADNLPSQPSPKDVDAIEWAINEMLFNNVNDNNSRVLCFFVDKELGMPHRVLNPILRLRDAFGEHEWPEARFQEQFWQFLEDYQLIKPTEYHQHSMRGYKANMEISKLMLSKLFS